MTTDTSTHEIPADLLDVPLAELRSRTSVKWRAYPPAVLPLWVAEMDVRPCPQVIEAVTAAMALGDTGYDHGTRYGAAFAAFAENRWGWRFDPELTRTVPDVMGGLTELIRLLTDPGDAVVVSPPVYPPFYGYSRNAGRRVIGAPLGQDGRLDPESLAAAFEMATEGGRRAVYLLCNPQNPTGVAHTPAELGDLLAIADRAGVRVIADEIHAPLAASDSGFTPLLTVDGSQRAMVVESASKAWNLAGLRAAVAVAGAEAVEDLHRLPEEVGHGVHHLAVIAHEAALNHGRPWLDAVLTQIADRRQLFTKLAGAHLPAIGYRPSAATYVAWLDCRGLPTEVAERPGQWFLEHAQVALSEGADYGQGGAGFARINLATSPAILTEAVGRMAAALARVGG